MADWRCDVPDKSIKELLDNTEKHCNKANEEIDEEYEKTNAT